MSNKLDLLERHNVGVPPDLKLPSDEEIDRIIAGAADPVLDSVKEIGYIPPSIKAEREVRQAEMEKLKHSSKLPLAKVLREAGIQPFTPESVTAYKKAMIKGRQLINGETVDRFLCPAILGGFAFNTVGCYLLGYLLTVKLGLNLNLGYLGFLPFASFICMWAFHSFGHDNAYTNILVALTSLPCALLFIFGPNGLEWRTIKLSNYTKDIPRPVLETVAEIRARFPGAHFEVEELIRIPDPFIVVNYGSERYHIEVWNEPKFNGNRAA